MIRSKSRSARTLGGVLSVTLALTGLSVIAATPAAAASAVVYDSIPDAQPAAYVSLGFAATSTTEFGDYVLLGGSNRTITEVTIGFTSWACETGGWNTNDCVTSDGSTFDHPITVTLYEASLVAGAPVAGAVIATVTETQSVPYRPSYDTTECLNGQWYDLASDTCYNGFATDLTFDFSSASPITGNDVIVGVAFNTQTFGAAPTGVPGPYDSLNVSLADDAPTVGIDEDSDEMMWATTFPSYDGSWSVDTGWGDYNGLVMEITAENVPAIDPLTEVTVFERDVEPNETPANYTEWHEGNPNASLDNSVVLEDGLHLGIGDPSTVIKGTDLFGNPAGQVITRDELRTLIERASVEVVSGSVTYQIPVFFGPDPLAPLFTTLRSTSLTAGSHSFSQADTWATTRAFGDYGVQETAPLGELIDAIYAQGGSVALAGYGVQADSPAVVSEVVWNDTRYTFFQPMIEACVPTVGPEVTDLALGDWDFSQTRTQGTNVFTEDGLEVSTFGAAGSPDQRKAAGYVPIDIALSEVGSVELDIAPGFTGVRPSLQLGFDVDGNGTRDAYLVGEPWVYGGGAWTLTVNGDWADANFWVTGSDGFGMPAGFGYPGIGPLDEWLIANPEASIVEYGYSLGSGVTGSAVIRSITVGCVTTPFGFEEAPPVPLTTTRLSGADRYGTAIAISQAGFPTGANTVYIATGAGYADALSAVPAAAADGAPLLLTQRNSVPAAVLAEITRLDPDDIVIVGGTGVVTAAAQTQLAAIATVTRVSGVDRYATSRAIAEYAFTTATSAYIATGLDFPDALAAGPAAASLGGPVVLVRGNLAAVDAATLALLDGLAVDDVLIAGGTSVVSEGISTQLDALYDVTRNSGADRHTTAIAINENAFTSEGVVYLANSEGFADALTGAVLAANTGAPIYVSPTACLPAAVLTSIIGLSATTLVKLGGTGVLSTNVANLGVCASS